MAPILGGIALPSRRRRTTAEHEDARTLESRFRALLEAWPEAVPEGCRVLIAFSGGSDSTALLHLLHAVSAERALDLRGAHFDHGLRDESRAEAERAVRTCEEVGVPCRTERAEGLPPSQARLREARYRFLRDEAGRVGARRIALAHQRDDQAETVLQRLLRGTGLRGLGGIPPRRGMLVRPLLDFGRHELRAWLNANDRSWLRDPANRDPRYDRARIRHGLLPALEMASGREAASRLVRIAADAALADRGLERRAARALASARVGDGEPRNGAQIARSALLGYDRADRARIVRKLARDLGFRLSRGGTAAAVEFISRGSSGHSVDVAGGLHVRREYDRIVLGPPARRPADREVEIRCAGRGTARALIGGRCRLVSWGVPVSEGEGEGERLALPVRGLAFPLRLRAPRPGDRIRMRAGSRKLKKLLNERRVPRSERPAVPVLVDARRRVLWVVGHAVASGEPGHPDEEMFTIAVRED